MRSAVVISKTLNGGEGGCRFLKRPLSFVLWQRCMHAHIGHCQSMQLQAYRHDVCIRKAMFHLHPLPPPTVTSMAFPCIPCPCLLSRYVLILNPHCISVPWHFWNIPDTMHVVFSILWQLNSSGSNNSMQNRTNNRFLSYIFSFDISTRITICPRLKIQRREYNKYEVRWLGTHGKKIFWQRDTVTLLWGRWDLMTIRKVKNVPY